MTREEYQQKVILIKSEIKSIDSEIEWINQKRNKFEKTLSTLQSDFAFQETGLRSGQTVAITDEFLDLIIERDGGVKTSFYYRWKGAGVASINYIYFESNTVVMETIPPGVLMGSIPIEMVQTMAEYWRTHND